jgi:hypothetical protein
MARRPAYYFPWVFYEVPEVVPLTIREGTVCTNAKPAVLLLDDNNLFRWATNAIRSSRA